MAYDEKDVWSESHSRTEIKTVLDRAGTVRKEVTTMAKNPPTGDGHRRGAVRDRSQVYNPTTDHWTKRDTGTGKFIDQKQNGNPFKGVRKEK